MLKLFMQQQNIGFLYIHHYFRPDNWWNQVHATALAATNIMYSVLTFSILTGEHKGHVHVAAERS